MGLDTSKKKLLYKATKDGTDFETIWDRIKNEEKLLFIVKSEHGKTFGGYIHKKLTRGESMRDDLSFAF